MFEGGPGQFAADQRHDAAVDVGAGDEPFVAKDAVGERRVDREPLRPGLALGAAALVLAQDRHGLFVRGEAAVDGHRVAQAELAGFVDAVDGDRSQLDEVRVEPAVPAHAVRGVAQGVRPVVPCRRGRRVAQPPLQPGHQAARLVVAADIAVHDAPERLVGDLELQPVVPAGGVGEVPRIDGVRALREAQRLIPVTGIRQDVAQRALQRRQQPPHPVVVAGRLPRQPGGLHEPVLDVGFDRHADVLRPVLPLAREFLGERRDVVEDAAGGGLRVGEVLHGAREVGLEVPEGAHHVAVVADPHGLGVRRPVAADGLAVDPEIQHVLPQEVADQRDEPVEGRAAGVNPGVSAHRRPP